MRAAGQRLTSFVRVSASQVFGFTSLSLQLSTREAMQAQLCAPSSLPAKSAFFLLCKPPHNRKNWLFAGSSEPFESVAWQTLSLRPPIAAFSAANQDGCEPPQPLLL